MSESNDRRSFLKGLGVAALSLGVASVADPPGLAQATSPEPAPAAMPAMPAAQAVPAPAAGPYLFFNPAEAAFIEAAVARLIPKDALGPGALEAGVPHFIDAQLLSWYGEAGRWYWQGPWQAGTPQQGYQLPLKPSELYRAGIAQVNAYTQKQFKADFATLTAAQQDALLSGLEKGEISLGSLPSRTFFAVLLQNTKEGFFADPVYGGNREMVGWKLIGYPGVQVGYAEIIEQYGTPFKEAPASIASFS